MLYSEQSAATYNSDDADYLTRSSAGRIDAGLSNFSSSLLADSDVGAIRDNSDSDPVSATNDAKLYNMPTVSDVESDSGLMMNVTEDGSSEIPSTINSAGGVEINSNRHADTASIAVDMPKFPAKNDL